MDEHSVALFIFNYVQKAEAEMAFELQAAKTRQRIKEEEMQVKVVERTQAIHVQEQEIQRRIKELESSVKQPAEAERFKSIAHFHMYFLDVLWDFIRSEHLVHGTE